jgi:hypothetical protein
MESRIVSNCGRSDPGECQGDQTPQNCGDPDQIVPACHLTHPRGSAHRRVSRDRGWKGQTLAIREPRVGTVGRAGAVKGEALEMGGDIVLSVPGSAERQSGLDGAEECFGWVEWRRAHQTSADVRHV